MTVLNEFFLKFRPKTNYEVDASDQFRRFYGNDVFVSNDLSSIGDYTRLRPEFQHLAGEWDAYAHAYTAGEVTRTIGSSNAHLAGDLNELASKLVGNNSPESENQDQWNNAHGRSVGMTSTSSSETGEI